MMWVVAGTLTIGSFIALLEAPYLIKKRMIKELWLFSIVLVTGITLSVVQELRIIPLPNPLEWIMAVYKPISEVIFGS